MIAHFLKSTKAVDNLTSSFRANIVSHPYSYFVSGVPLPFRHNFIVLPYIHQRLERLVCPIPCREATLDAKKQLFRLSFDLCDNTMASSVFGRASLECFGTCSPWRLWYFNDFRYRRVLLCSDTMNRLLDDIDKADLRTGHVQWAFAQSRTWPDPRLFDLQ